MFTWRTGHNVVVVVSLSVRPHHQRRVRFAGFPISRKAQKGNLLSLALSILFHTTCCACLKTLHSAMETTVAVKKEGGGGDQKGAIDRYH